MKQISAALLVLALSWSVGGWAIINATIVSPGDYREVVKIGTDLSCNGVLVGSRVVATAAHCVHHAQQASVATQDGLHFGATFVESPLYPQQNHDLAFGILSQDVQGSDPAWISSRPVALGESVILVGSGCARSDQPIDGVLRAGETVVGAFSSPFQFLTQGEARALACYGDSGAPAFTGQGEGREVAGIIAAGNLTTTSYLVRFDNAESQALMHNITASFAVEICGFEGGCGARHNRK